MASDTSETPSRDVESLPAQADELVITQIPRESLKSLFYLVAGKPDSLYKVFSGLLLIAPTDLSELNYSVCAKLAHFEMVGVVTTITITHMNGLIKEFGSWAEFEATNWSGPEVTEAVTLRWDFLAKLPSYNMPQRHTATVRIGSDPSPLHMLQAIFSQDPEDVSKLDMLFAPVICRVDFINSLLAQEFINIVENWHNGRRNPTKLSSRYFRLLRHRKIIKDMIR